METILTLKSKVFYLNLYKSISLSLSRECMNLCGKKEDKKDGIKNWINWKNLIILIFKDKKKQNDAKSDGFNESLNWIKTKKT